MTNRIAAMAAALAAFFMPSLGRAADYQYPFQNPDLSVDQRVDNLLSLMTVQEKIACLGTNPSVPRLGVRGTNHVEGLHGEELAQPGHSVAQAGGGRGGPAGNAAGAPADVTAGAQTQPASQPAGRGFARRATPTTTFPQEIGMGETWDAPLIDAAAALEGNEMRYAFHKYSRGGLVLRAPNADLGRDPRWGRTEECFGEDPFFNGSMVVAFVKGLQGDDPHYLQAASLMKHFLANSNEDTRTSSSSDFDERLLREYYSVPFRMGIEEAHAQAFMASYNKVNGVPMTVNAPLIDDMARKEWGLDGIICTDGQGMSLMVTDHKYFPDNEHAVAATIKATIGQFLDRNRTAATQALHDNLLTEADLDNALRGVFRVMIRLGMLDSADRVAYTKIAATDPWLSDDHKALARQVTRESIVLLKNFGNLLPLDKQKLKSVAVIGTKANVVLYDWYSGQPPYAVTPLEGVKKGLGSDVTVRYASSDDAQAAAKLASSADVATVVVGNHPTCNAPWNKTESPSEGKESVDRKAITLDEEPLVQAVYAANPRTVVVLVSSFPYAINWTQQNVPAILHMTHCSQEEGNALADVLSGDYIPAGRLVQTWPSSLDQLPPLMDYNIRHGRTYMYFSGEPLYPFGYGLSYTTFDYSNLQTSADALAADNKASITVSVDVKNTGQRDGDEVVQLYVKHLGSKVDRPLKELKGFSRVPLKSGETKTVRMTLGAKQLAYWEPSRHDWVIEPDRVQLMIGASSSDIKLNHTITVGS